MKNTTVTVGFSGNPALTFQCSDGPGDKGRIDSFHVGLEGASLNFATLLSKWGYNPNVLLPVAVDESIESEIFEIILKKSELTITRMPVLETSPIAKVENGKIHGKKSVVKYEKALLEKEEQKIINSDGKWRVANGINASLAPFAAILLRDKNGYGTLSPHYTLCSDPTSRHLLISLLKKCDLLILNKSEFALIGPNFKEVHDLGVSIIIVTDGENGGTISVCNQATNGKACLKYFNAEKVSTKKLHTVGAGDCFSASLHISFIESAYSFKTGTLDFVYDACIRATKVVAVKITMPGASNVPSRADFESIF